jgi:hypothetical protein
MRVPNPLDDDDELVAVMEVAAEDGSSRGPLLSLGVTAG